MNPSSSTATPTTTTLQIDGMCGDACVQKVTATLETVPGVSVDSVTVGSATITCDDAAALQAARTALTAAGAKLRNSDAAPGSGCTNKSTDGQNAAASKGGCNMVSEGAGGALAAPATTNSNAACTSANAFQKVGVGAEGSAIPLAG